MLNLKHLTLFAPLALAVATPAMANNAFDDDPKWYATFKFGLYQPEAEQWKDFYGSSTAPIVGLGLNYRPWRTLSFGANIHLAQDKGSGNAVLSGRKSGNAEIDMYPATVEATWHGAFTDFQKFIPYASIGWLRIGYRGEVEGNPNVMKGSIDGVVWRAGLQWEMNRYDRRSAKSALQNYGIDATYLLFEYADYTAEDTFSGVDVDLSGSAYSLGVGVAF